MLCNHTSRYDVAIAAIQGGALHNSKVAVSAHQTVSYLKHIAQKDKEYILANGQGMSEGSTSFIWLMPALDRPGVFDVPTF